MARAAQEALLDRLAGLDDPIAPRDLRARIGDLVRSLELSNQGLSKYTHSVASSAPTGSAVFV